MKKNLEKNKKYQGYLIDLDGTIYLGNEPIPAGKRFIEELQRRNLPYLLVTNNTTKTPKMVKDRLSNEFDIQVSEQNIYTAAFATVDYMLDRNLGKKVFVIGELGLQEAIFKAGFIEDKDHPDYVVVGLDREISYEKATLATLAIQKGAAFIGTNPDLNIPTERGLLPGAGSLVRFIEAATQVEPIYIGKPQAIIMDKALEIIGCPRQQTIMVGDNYLTDIKAGIDNNIDTLLVTTGFTPASQVESLPIAPTYVRGSLDEWDFASEN